MITLFIVLVIGRNIIESLDFKSLPKNQYKINRQLPKN